MEIVFVHFGSPIPRYLQQNISRVCRLFPDKKITLITDSSVFTDNIDADVGIYAAKFDSTYSYVNNLLNHPKDFRNNFWFTSLSRLMALCDYVNETHLSVLHIESDVLVSDDFPIDQFQGLDRPLAYTMLGDLRAVASIFFLRDAEAARHLRQYISDSVTQDPHATDMTILGDYQRNHPDFVRILASFPEARSEFSTLMTEEIRNDFRYSFEKFDGYFDAADIGQFLMGDDPRNHRGVKIVRGKQKTSYLDPSAITYSYSNKRKFLNLESKNSEKIYSLHIHSKDPHVFNPKKTEKSLIKSVLNQKKPQYRKFILKVFLNSIIKSLRRRLLVVAKVAKSA